MTAPANPWTPRPELKPDMLRALPGGVMDDSTYEAVEEALDKAEAPCRDESGRWLTLAERVDALSKARGEDPDEQFPNTLIQTSDVVIP